MKNALIGTVALALVAMTATAAPFRKPAFALSKIRATANTTTAAVNQYQIYYDFADYEIWDENQTDYAYKNSKGQKVTDSSSNWNFTSYATYYYGKGWEKDWKFGKFWWYDQCTYNNCEGMYPEAE